LHDRCDTCPLSIYIDVVCDNTLEKLVISGKPGIEVLQEAKFRLVAEFSELSGNTAMKNYMAGSKSYYRQLNVIKGLEIAHSLVRSGRISSATDFMKSVGIPCNENAKAEEMLLSIERQIKAKVIKLKDVRRRMEQPDKTGNGQGYTRRYFNRLLAALSTCEAIHIQLDRSKMTVAEFAEYINIYNEYMTHINNLKHGRKQ
jgi:hypothetical protein